MRDAEKAASRLHLEESAALEARQIATFIEQVEKAPAALEGWDSQIWSLLLEKGTVNRDGTITFEFKNGIEIRVEAP